MVANVQIKREEIFTEESVFLIEEHILMEVKNER